MPRLREQTADTDPIEARLQAWAAWLKCRGSGAGFPTMNPMHPQWQPPSPGQTPTLKTGGQADGRERETHGKVALLSPKQQAALVVVYVKRLDAAAQAVALQCQPSTVRARIVSAKQHLRRLLL